MTPSGMHIRLKLLLSAAALALALGSSNAAGQDGVPLRAVYQGAFLPEGTTVVVMAREASIERDGRPQPDFIRRDDYPRQAELVLTRDVLGGNGRSSLSYTPTDRARTLYFIYALTPDSTVYWSYSAQRDSLKFDVVNTGVMSVAPILTGEIREDVIRRFFRPRVLVRMPGDDVRLVSTGRPEADSQTPDSEASDSQASDSQTPDSDAPDSSVVDSLGTVSTAEATDSETFRFDDPASVRPVASATPPPARRSGPSDVRFPIGVPAFIALFLIAAVSVVAAQRYRGEARRLRRRCTDLEKELSDRRERIS